MDYPEVISYLDQNKIDKQQVSWLVTNANGVIVDVGSVGDLLLADPVVGAIADDFIPVLVGLFPLSKNRYLPNVQIVANRYHNLHLLLLDDKVVVLFNDVTDKIKNFKQQTANEINAMSLFQELDYWVLKQENEGQFEPVCSAPLWLDGLLAEIKGSPDIEELFPFLSPFLEQLPVKFIEGDKHKFYSGIWTNAKPDGDEVYLNAWVIQQPGINYLLIHPVDLTASFGDNIIQVAHENSLAYEQLQKIKKQLTDVLALKDQFVSIVSHDFRSPVSTLINGISYLIEDVETNKSFNEINMDIIVHIKSELSRLLDYNNKLYEWTRYNLDRFDVHFEKLSFDNFVMDLIFQFETRLKEKNITLKPTIQNPAVLYTDISLLQQVLINLIDNAIKFTSEGGEIQLIIEGDSISVVDHGIGLTAQQITHIKKGYYMESHQGTDGEQGTGVGLSIVSKILKTLNYGIDIRSEIGNGSTFTITYNR